MTITRTYSTYCTKATTQTLTLEKPPSTVPTRHTFNSRQPERECKPHILPQIPALASHWQESHVRLFRLFRDHSTKAHSVVLAFHITLSSRDGKKMHTRDDRIHEGRVRPPPSTARPTTWVLVPDVIHTEVERVLHARGTASVRNGDRLDRKRDVQVRALVWKERGKSIV